MDHICISLMVSDAEHLFGYLFTICVSSVKHLFIYSAHFLKGLFVGFLLLSFVNSLYNPDANSLLDDLCIRC